jgi:hypothetical protein
MPPHAIVYGSRRRTVFAGFGSHRDDAGGSPAVTPDDARLALWLAAARAEDIRQRARRLRVGSPIQLGTPLSGP